MDAKLKLVAAALLGALLVVIVWFQPFATSAQRADASYGRLRPLLKSSPRWAHVGCMVGTEGLIQLKGSISSATAAPELMALIKGSKPSCDVEVSVYVYEADQPSDGADHVRGYYHTDGTSQLELAKAPYATYGPVAEPSSGIHE